MSFKFFDLREYVEKNKKIELEADEKTRILILRNSNFYSSDDFNPNSKFSKRYFKRFFKAISELNRNILRVGLELDDIAFMGWEDFEKNKNIIKKMKFFSLKEYLFPALEKTIENNKKDFENYAYVNFQIFFFRDSFCLFKDFNEAGIFSSDIFSRVKNPNSIFCEVLKELYNQELLRRKISESTFGDILIFNSILKKDLNLFYKDIDNLIRKIESKEEYKISELRRKFVNQYPMLKPFFTSYEALKKINEDDVVNYVNLVDSKQSQ